MKKLNVLRRRRKHVHGMASMDFYACQSGIRHWNGSYKVFSAVLILALCLILDRPRVSVFIICSMGLLNMAGNRVSPGNYLRLLKIPAAFAVMGSAALMIGISAEPAGDFQISLPWFWLYVTEEGMVHALEVVLKAMGALSAMFVLALSTPAGELAAVLRKARLPGVVTELMYMVYRFIFILAEVHRTMRNAAVSRLGDVDFKTSCSTFGQIGGNLLILSLKKANTYYDAMVSRGYEGEFCFWEEEKPVKAWQIPALVGYVMILVFCRLTEGL